MEAPLNAKWYGTALLAVCLVGFGCECRAQYGDVDGDGKVTVADAQSVLAYARGRRYGGKRDLRIARYGDVDPRASATTFGDRAIKIADGVRVLRRAAGLETDQPALDYWPLNPAVRTITPTIPADSYSYADQFGDMSTASVPSTYAYQGYTVRVYGRTDGAQYDIFKDAVGDLYLVKATFPPMDGVADETIAFSAPIPLLYQKQAASGSLTSWSGRVNGQTTNYGLRPFDYTVTILRKESTLVPAAGSLAFDDTLVVRVGFAAPKTATLNNESQQAWFLWLAPYVGPIQEGRAAVRTALTPDTQAKSLWQAQAVAIRGTKYPQ
jgi:hypothetical protein